MAKPTQAKAGAARAGRGKDQSASSEELLQYYRDMLLIRRFEEKAGQLYGMGLIGGFCHLYIGQEAVVVGLQAVAEEGDSIITSYRDHGHMLATGMDAKGVMAELKLDDIRAMSEDQMSDAIVNLKKERFNLRFQRATGQLENTSRLREARRDIARIKTVAAQKRAAKTK